MSELRVDKITNENADGAPEIQDFLGSQSLKVPVGTTAQRPENPEAGMIRFNTDEGYVEWYDDVTDNWIAISTFPAVIATGGTVTDITQDGVNYRVHTFTSDGTFNVTRAGEVEYLVVAGGGAGGVGGGGGGGYRCSVFGELSGGNSPAESPLQLAANSYSVVVGAGGQGTSVYGNNQGNPGENSSFAGIVSIGGGSGGGSVSDPSTRDGGSGGGGRNNSGSTGTGGSGTAGQGTNGGSGTGVNGGGGAGQAGIDGSSSTNGGNGLESSIDGVATFRAGGGGGGTTSSDRSGGLGGGTNGTFSSILNSPANSGGGSGGNWSANFGAASGGSGIVIVRYRIG